MKKIKRTKTEAAYKQFEKRSRICLFSLLSIIIASVVWLVIAQNAVSEIEFIGLILLETILIILVSSAVTKKRNKYLQLIIEERNSIVRTGLFKEIYEEYLHDGFEFNISYDKLLHEEYCNNSFDIGVQRNKHEFLIEIDENAMSIIVDEETNNPIEIEYPLSKFSTTEQLYSAINDFISMHS